MSPVLRRWSIIGTIIIALSSSGLLLAPSPAQESESDADGRELFLSNCASCHGADARGTDSGPDITEVGAASADFQLRTGRMPLADPNAQAVRKPSAFNDEQIDALVTYVASLGAGPDIPEVELTGADISAGQEIFINNCAPCHGASGNGGAVGAGALAPNLYAADPIEVAEAMITGPGQMPKFAFDRETQDDVVAFVYHLQRADRPGGADIGGVGPVPEGFVGWGVGVGALVGVCVLLGSKRKRNDER